MSAANYDTDKIMFIFKIVLPIVLLNGVAFAIWNSYSSIRDDQRQNIKQSQLQNDLFNVNTTITGILNTLENNFLQNVTSINSILSLVNMTAVTIATQIQNLQIIVNSTNVTESFFLSLISQELSDFNATINTLLGDVQMLQAIVPVTNIELGDGMVNNGTNITTTGLVAISDTGVVPDQYTYSSITVDRKGRITVASSGVTPITTLTLGIGLEQPNMPNVSIITAPSGGVQLTNTTVSEGSYEFASVVVDPQGRITSISNGTDYGPLIALIQTDIQTLQNQIMDVNVTCVDDLGMLNMTLAQLVMNVENILATGTGSVSRVDTGTGLEGGPIFVNGTISLSNTTVVPGTYTAANIEVDQQGRILNATSGSVGVTQITAGTGLTGGVINSVGTISLAPSGVAPGTYGSSFVIPSIGVSAQGIVTSMSLNNAQFIAFYGSRATTQALGGGTGNYIQWDDTTYVGAGITSVFGGVPIQLRVSLPRRIVEISCRVVSDPQNYILEIGNEGGITITDRDLQIFSNNFATSYVITWYARTLSSYGPGQGLVVGIRNNQNDGANVYSDGTFLSIKVVGSY